MTPGSSHQQDRRHERPKAAPVGSIKEQVLAAQRAGLREVMLPARNRKDLHDVPERTRQALHFTWLAQQPTPQPARH